MAVLVSAGPAAAQSASPSPSRGPERRGPGDRRPRGRLQAHHPCRRDDAGWLAGPPSRGGGHRLRQPRARAPALRHRGQQADHRRAERCHRRNGCGRYWHPPPRQRRRRRRDHRRREPLLRGGHPRDRDDPAGCQVRAERRGRFRGVGRGHSNAGGARGLGDHLGDGGRRSSPLRCSPEASSGTCSRPSAANPHEGRSTTRSSDGSKAIGRARAARRELPGGFDRRLPAPRRGHRCERCEAGRRRLGADRAPRRSDGAPAQARGRHRDPGVRATLGRWLRDDREPSRSPPLPTRGLGSGIAPDDGRHAHGQGDRDRAVRGFRRDGAVHRDRPGAFAVSGQLPRTALRRRPEHGDPCHGSGDRTTPQGPAVR